MKLYIKSFCGKLAVGGVCFALSVLVAVLYLIGGALLPQTLIHDNLVESADFLSKDTRCWPAVFDGSYASTIDNYTDALMLMEADLTNSADFSTIFTNPCYKTATNTVEDLIAYANGTISSPLRAYLHYWLGFRGLLRLALVFFNYTQIRRYMALAFFLLLVLATCSVARNTRLRYAAALAVTIVLVRPHIICWSMQLTCCFFIAFLAMLFVPYVYKHPNYGWLFFFELGIITMFFDYYTVPLITAGLPLIYLYIISAERGKALSAGKMISSLAVWLAGYILMWLAKLTLTTIFSEYDGFADGFSSASHWIGGSNSALSSVQSPLIGLKAVAYSLCSDGIGSIAVAAALLFSVIGILLMLRNGALDISALGRHLPLLIPMGAMLLWCVVAATPLSYHGWMQYRTVVIPFWASGAWLCLSYRDTPGFSRLKRLFTV